MKQPDTPRRQAGVLTAAFAAVIIAALTIVPGQPGNPTAPPLCILCTERGMADAILNVLLFVPLGVGLMLILGSSARAALAAALGSILIETIQFFLPGRDASIGDVLTNTLGALAGAGLVHTWRLWIKPTDSRAAWLRRAWAVLSFVLLSAGSFLLVPALPGSEWYGQWTPRLGHLEMYRGRVLSARLGSLTLPSQRLADSEAVRAALKRGDTLDVIAVAGPNPQDLAPILSIYDDEQREILLMGARGSDFVVRYRTRGQALLLDGAELRVPGAFGLTRAGDTLRLHTTWQDREVAIRINKHRTSDGMHTGDGWLLLAYSQHLPPAAARIAPVIWLGFWFFPLGFWTLGRLRNLLEAAALWLAVCAIPLAVPIRHLPVPLIITAPVAALAGLLTYRLAGAVRLRRSQGYKLARARTHRSIRS